MSFNGSGVFNINTAGQPVVSGTVISATAFNALTADLATGLSTCLTKDGQTNPTANIPMANYKFTGLGAGSDATDSANLSQVQSTVVKLIGTISGADTITGSLVPALTAYAAGQMFYFVAAGDNTGAVTLNINSLGAKNVTKDGTTALSAAEIKSGQTVVVVYDGTRFQMVNPVVVGLTGITTATTTALGVNAGDSITSGTNNTIIGYNAGTAVTSGTTNVLIGEEAGLPITSGFANTQVGYKAGATGGNANANTFIGYLCGNNIAAGNNTAVGQLAMQAGASSPAVNNVAVGVLSLASVSNGGANVAVGYKALEDHTDQGGGSAGAYSYNTGIGYEAGKNITTGYVNTMLGGSTGGGITTGAFNTALGFEAYNTGNYSNSTCVGSSSAVTGSNQVQLGDSSTTTYAYGAVQDRSDARDKADIQDSNLGLAFVMQLQPRMFRWDMREDYRSKPPKKPQEENYNNLDEYKKHLAIWKIQFNEWQEACKLANLTHDGTHKRSRFHYGLVAQEVKATMDAMGVDFGGYQDHKVKGGDDVLSLGYEEMIAPLIKAIQELKAEFDAYKATHP
jgi:hypothetical protein